VAIHPCNAFAREEKAVSQGKLNGGLLHGVRRKQDTRRRSSTEKPSEGKTREVKTKTGWGVGADGAVGLKIKRKRVGEIWTGENPGLHQGMWQRPEVRGGVPPWVHQYGGSRIFGREGRFKMGVEG